MANPCPNLQKSGIPEGSKRATASQEILRRLKNTSRELGAEIITEILTDYMGELTMGGYTFNWRREVLLGAVIGYRRLWVQEHQGTGQINRDSKVTSLKRRAQKLTGKSEWFKNKTTKKDPLKLTKFSRNVRSHNGLQDGLTIIS